MLRKAGSFVKNPENKINLLISPSIISLGAVHKVCHAIFDDF